MKDDVLMNFSKYAPDLAGYGRRALGKDVLSSLVVFLVAVPLGLGIALASGAPLVSGIIACAVGGLVAGLLSGAPLQVSGPAAGLTLLTYGVIQQFGWPMAVMVFAAAGVMQLAFGVLGIGRSCLMISPAVVKGMLAGIGVVIALAQMHVLLGGTPQSSAVRNLLELPQQMMALNSHATIVGLITLGLLIGWEFLPKRVKAVPGALVAIVVATLISTTVWTDVARIQLPDSLLTFARPTLPEGSQWGAFLLAAASVAIVASVESLLCAVATDKLHQGPRARLNQELIAQGTANVVSGLLGGLPVTGVIVRSSANIQAGAVSRVSAILYGVWILLFIALFAGLVRLIPLAALAGLLVYVGAKLVNFQHIRELKNHREELIYGITLVGVVSLGLLQGVGLGIALAFILLLRRLSRVKIDTDVTEQACSIRMDGVLTFLNVPRMSAQLNTLPAGRAVEVDLAADYMDHAAFEALKSWKSGYEATGGQVTVHELHSNWYQAAVDGKPRVAPEANGRYALANLLGAHDEVEEHNLHRGVGRFRRSLAEAMRPLYNRLGTEGQSPKTLFITCCDSRIDPALITAARPGELFVLRNIGNIVPRPGGAAKDVSVQATLEYALNVLKVQHIVVCGHSDCGAMKALHNHSYDAFESLGAWLEDSHSCMPGELCHGHLDKGENLVSRWNVAEQLGHLLENREVAELVTAGQVELHGWYFEIESAEVYQFDREGQAWHPLAGVRELQGSPQTAA